MRAIKAYPMCYSTTTWEIVPGNCPLNKGGCAGNNSFKETGVVWTCKFLDTHQKKYMLSLDSEITNEASEILNTPIFINCQYKENSVRFIKDA